MKTKKSSFTQSLEKKSQNHEPESSRKGAGLVEKSDVEDNKITAKQSHGTTTIGIVNSIFVILASDGKGCLANGNMITLKMEKVRLVCKEDLLQLWSARSGVSDKCRDVADRFPEFLDLARKESDLLKSFSEQLKATPGIKGDWQFIFGGFKSQAEGEIPFLFPIEPGELHDQSNYYSCGSGSDYALRVLDNIPSIEALTLDEAIVWVKRALIFAAIMDHGTGGMSDIKIIGEGGRRVTSIKKEAILTTMLNKHIKYFEELRETNATDFVANRVCWFDQLSKRNKKKWIGGSRLSNDAAWLDYSDDDGETDSEIEGMEDISSEDEDEDDEPGPSSKKPRIEK